MHGDVGADIAAVVRYTDEPRGYLYVEDVERIIAERVEAAKAEALREAADDLLTFSRGTRDAWRNHNAGRDLGKQRQIRPDLNNWADATEAASHRIRNRAAALDPGPPCQSEREGHPHDCGCDFCCFGTVPAAGLDPGPRP